MNDKLLNLIRLNPTTSDGNYDWTTILKLAEEQSVLGAALKGVQRLPPSKYPPRFLLLKWIAQAEAIKKQNERVNAVLSHLVSDLKEEGLHPIVVKGQIVAQEYEETLLRQSGDIDILFCEQDWNKIESWLQNKNIHYICALGEKHIEFDYESVTIEFHWKLNAFSSQHSMEYWKDQIESKISERQRKVAVDGFLTKLSHPKIKP